MRCIIRTLNPVTLSFAQAVLKDAEIEAFMFDANCSVLDGYTTIVEKRLMVIDEDYEEAREILTAAGLGKELLQSEPQDMTRPRKSLVRKLYEMYFKNE